MAVIARFGTRDVCLIEILRADASTGSAPLRVELFDRARGHAVESVACNDLEAAEAATGELMDDAREGVLGNSPTRSERGGPPGSGGG
ncbi:hypothetical protein [Methylobacterium nigriterrae]|uniref:hypothetical protein n=1 Tax=Methylobacterium nigriterrae TaxID=3127512 RepID=UPI0030135D7C